LCGKADESIAHFTLNCEKLADATTAAHDIARRRLSKTLEKTLTKSPYRWVFHWEKQAGLAFPALVGTQGSHNWDERTEVWVNLSIPSCDLDKLRPHGIHFCYDQSGIIIQHTVSLSLLALMTNLRALAGTNALKHTYAMNLSVDLWNRLLLLLATWPFWLWVFALHSQGVLVAQWAKRPPLKLEVPGSSPRGWFNGRAGNRDPFRWLETARGLSPIRLIGRAQYFPGGLAVSSLERVP
jgi:hypothetical protein